MNAIDTTEATTRTQTERSLLGRLGRFTVRRRWYVIAAWAVLLVVMGTFASGLQDRLGSGGFEVPGSQSLAVQHDLERRFANQFPTTALVTVHDEARTVDDPAYRSLVQNIAARVRAVPNVGGVESFVTTGSPAFVSPDRHTTYLVVGLSGSQNTSSTPPPGSPRSPAATCPRAWRCRPAAAPPSSTGSTRSPATTWSRPSG